MILVGLVVIGGPYGYWGRICILIIGNGDSDSNIALKVFDYPFDVEVGDGLPGFPGLEPAAQKFDDICQSRFVKQCVLKL